MNTRMDRTKLNIGAYILQPYARSEEHIKELAECGINLVICMDYDKLTLDLLQKYHIGVIVSGVMPEWWGGDGFNAGTMEQSNPFSRYIEAAERFEDHPAIWGVSTGDEPSVLDLPYYGKVIDFVEGHYPDQFAYLNLYPDYALNPKGTEEETEKCLRTSSYEKYIETYCKNVATDYICFDYYMYAANIEGAYHSMQTVAEVCRKYERSMWVVLQVNSYEQDIYTSENQLRFQAYMAMAFGAENIFWACYTAGWWYNQVLDENGNKTEQYEKLKRVNHELSTLGNVYMQYRCIDTFLVGKQDVGYFKGIHTESGNLLIVGHMKHRTNTLEPEAIMICAADDPYDRCNQLNVVSFQANADQVVLYIGESRILLHADEQGIYRFQLRSCYGAMVIIGEEL